MPSARLYKLNVNQDSAYLSPWSVRARAGMLLWWIVWRLLYRPTPKFCNAWRLFLLRLFGCTIHGRPFVSQSSFIRIPWQLTLEDRCCLGEHAEIYNLGPVSLRARCIVAQHTYLCSGTHDFSDPDLPLLVGPIEVGPDVFLGAKAIILPGVRIGAAAVIGAGAVVTKDQPAGMICAGNPCRAIKPRPAPPASQTQPIR